MSTNVVEKKREQTRLEMMPKGVNITGFIPGPIKGITERDRPINAGFCGNDSCEHTGHKARRSAQKAADKRKHGK